MSNEFTGKCYTCKHKGNVAGSAHSSCNALGEPFEVMMYVLSGTEPRVPIQANSHGIESGWFTWPIDFDPTWLEYCGMYEEKDESI